MSSSKIVRAKSLKWVAAGVVSVGSVLAVGLTASAKSPAAGPQVATLAEPHAVPARAKVTAAKHKPAKHAVKRASKKHTARKTTKHVKHTAVKGKRRPVSRTSPAPPCRPHAPSPAANVRRASGPLEEGENPGAIAPGFCISVLR